MPFVTIDGIATRYETIGSGEPLLMFAPGGFNAVIETWSTQSIYATIKLLDHLPKQYTCIVFDRRECGQSGGRVEAITWGHYVAQAKGLLEHLGIQRAHMLGGCMGCCPVATFGTMHPQMVRSMVLWWPVGGAKYRIASHKRFNEHLAFVKQNGLEAVVELVRKDGKPFGAEPRGGPWASVIKHDRAFADEYAKQDVRTYRVAVAGMMRNLFDRDTAPGAEPEDLLKLKIPTLVIPGQDASHATSAARYLQECLDHSDYWDVPVAEQRQDNATQRIMTFLERASA
jgi:pimeloyl-ACP methyl ester carboxylesterase